VGNLIEAVQKFDSSGVGYVGYNNEGRIWAGNFPKIDGLDVLQGAIIQIQDPTEFLKLIPKAMNGDQTIIGYLEGGNDQILEITETGVLATLDLIDGSYELELDFEEFLPILKDWEDAWAAAQEYKKTMSHQTS
jgi:hypothetical protein